jgi:predicted nucleic acid-binding protein
MSPRDRLQVDVNVLIALVSHKRDLHHRVRTWFESYGVRITTA